MTSLGRGVFVPVPTFFKENEDLDLEAFDRHVEYLANSGIAGIVVLGSMGEAVNLSDNERIQVIQQCSDSVQKYNRNLKIIAGASSQSARNTITYTKQAAEAGAGFVLVLPPSFYKGSMNHDALYQFYTAVADQSPVPVVIYNYPGVCQGLDLSIPLLVELSKHKNIVGVKGTDGNVGKMANLVNKTNPEGECKMASVWSTACLTFMQMWHCWLALPISSCQNYWLVLLDWSQEQAMCSPRFVFKFRNYTRAIDSRRLSHYKRSWWRQTMHCADGTEFQVPRASSKREWATEMACVVIHFKRHPRSMQLPLKRLLMQHGY